MRGSDSLIVVVESVETRDDLAEAGVWGSDSLIIVVDSTETRKPPIVVDVGMDSVDAISAPPTAADVVDVRVPAVSKGMVDTPTDGVSIVEFGETSASYATAASLAEMQHQLATSIEQQQQQTTEQQQ